MRVAVTPTELAGLGKAERVALLRRRIAAMPGQRSVANGNEGLPVPTALSGLLPSGGLARGSVAVYVGPNSLLLGLLAAVTGAGHAAVVGKPELGLLAAVEMGAQLERVAVIPDPGPDRLEIASILLDGLDLVVLELSGATVAPSRAKILTARARNSGSVLLVTGGGWSHPELRMWARVADFAGVGRGTGRLHAISLDIVVQSKGFQQQSARMRLDDSGTWTREPAAARRLGAVS